MEEAKEESAADEELATYMEAIAYFERWPDLKPKDSVLLIEGETWKRK